MPNSADLVDVVAVRASQKASALPETGVATHPQLTLRLLTLNIHKGFSVLNRRFVLRELREAIRTSSADIVCLQEVLGEHRGHQARHSVWPEQPQYEFLADSIWHQHAYGRNAVYTEGHHGNAVLSKFPIVGLTNHDVSIKGPEQRGMLHCVLQLPHGRRAAHIICVHLSLLESHRAQQLQKLCELIDKDVPPDAPLIVAGDFNDWRLQAHEALARGAGLTEAFVGSSGKAARSFPARWPLLRLDRIYCRNVVSATPVPLQRRPWSHLSDHMPLIVELML